MAMDGGLPLLVCGNPPITGRLCPLTLGLRDLAKERLINALGCAEIAA